MKSSSSSSYDNVGQLKEPESISDDQEGEHYGNECIIIRGRVIITNIIRKRRRKKSGGRKEKSDEEVEAEELWNS